MVTSKFLEVLGNFFSCIFFKCYFLIFYLMIHTVKYLQPVTMVCIEKIFNEWRNHHEILSEKEKVTK